MENKHAFHPYPSLKLMDQVLEVLCYYHYAYRTETSYCQWILRYIRFFGNKTRPKNLCPRHVVWIWGKRHHTNLLLLLSMIMI